jgi:hypothetical protein
MLYKIIVNQRFRGTCCLHHQGDESYKYVGVKENHNIGKSEKEWLKNKGYIRSLRLMILSAKNKMQQIDHWQY